jgi:diamine N-acetyltransferase
MGDPFTIREATIADAEPLSIVARNTFVATFGGGYPPADLAAFLAESYGPEIQAEEIADPTARTLIAEEGEDLVGYVQMGTMGLPFDTGDRVVRELKRLYIVDRMKGRGLAQRLMEETIAWALAQGAQDLYLGVWAENARALNFYARNGFEVVGRYTYQVGNTGDDERIMRRRLAD